MAAATCRRFIRSMREQEITRRLAQEALKRLKDPTDPIISPAELRRRLQTRKDDGFRQFVEDQLAPMHGLVCKSMFGGYGLYAGGTFFGIIYRGRLHFKTDAKTRPAYVARGMKPFRPSAKQTLKSYYEVPADILESGEALITWARDAAKIGK